MVTPLLVTSIGEPLAMRNPHMQVNMLAHPQASAVMTVATMPSVLFCIFLLLYKYRCETIISLTVQLRAGETLRNAARGRLYFRCHEVGGIGSLMLGSLGFAYLMDRTPTITGTRIKITPKQINIPAPSKAS